MSVVEFLLPKRIQDVLNEAQLATLKEMMSKSDGIIVELRQLLNVYCNDTDLYRAIIDRFILPYNEKKFLDAISSNLKDGEFHVIAVPGDEENNNVSHAYTLGLTEKYGVEIMCAANIDPILLGNIVSCAGELLNTKGTLDGLKDSPKFRASAGTCRLRVDRTLLLNVIDEYLSKLTQHVSIIPGDEVLVIRLADMNNILPGEKGYDTSLIQPEIKESS